MISQDFLITYFWSTYGWFCIGFTVIGIGALREAIGMIAKRGIKEKR